MSGPQQPVGGALVVTSLRVHEAPGFPRDAGFVLPDLRPGINILYGRNGAGKSTAVRAMLDLLWAVPDTRREAVTLTLRRDGADWELDYNHGRMTSVCAGAEAGWSWPYGPELRPLPLLVLRDLLTRQEQGAALAALVRREMRGGYDPAAAARAVGAMDRAHAASIGEVTQLQNARARVRELTTAQAELAAAMRERVRWLERQQAAKAAQGRLAEWRDVEAWRAAVAHERAKQAALATERDNAAALLPDPEAVRLAREALQRARADLSACDDRLAVLAHHLAAAQAQANAALARIDTAADAARATLDVPAVDAWDDLLTAAEQVRAVAALHARAEAGLGPRLDAAARAIAGERLDTLREAARQLQTWLTLPAPAAGAAPVQRGVVAAAAALLAPGAVLVWLGVAPWGWLLVGAGVGAAAVAWWLPRRGARADSGAAAHVEAAYARLRDVPQPAAWTQADVQTVAGRVAAELAETQRRYVLADVWVSLAAAGDPQAEQAALAARVNAVRARLGAAPGLDLLALSRLADLLRQWQTANARVAQLQGEHAAQVRQRDVVLTAAVDAAAAAGVTVTAAEGVTALDAAIADIEERLRRHDADAKRVDEAALARRDAEMAAAALRGKLAAATLARVATLSDDEIAQQREADAALAAEYERWVKQIQDVDTRVSEATAGHELATALAEQEQALAALAAKRRDNVRRFLLAHLAAGVLQVGDKRFKPALMARAERLFAQITQGRYELSLSPNDDAFMVLDSERDRRLALDALSDGTRVQLLLALRLANLEQEEARTGLRLPLVLDEVLANSDDERAAALIAAVRTVASERQVFVLTAQRDEVNKWQAAAQGNAAEAHVVELRPARVVAPGAVTTLPVAVPPLAPGARLADLVAALAVPQPALDVPAAGTHMGAVLLALCGGQSVDAALVLHKLAGAGLNTAGALLAVCEDSPEAARAWLRGAATPEAFAAAVRAWDIARARIAQGRGKPLDYAFVKKHSRGGKGDEVWAVAEAVGRDAASCLARLEDKAVKGFGPAGVADLREACVEAGYLDLAPMLERGAVREALAVALATPLVEGTLPGAVLDRIVELLWPPERER